MDRIARAWRIGLIAAFLLAQNAALAHPLWHLGGLASAQTGLSSGPADEGKTPRDGPLCDFHTALGSVLGALSTSAFAAQLVEPAHTAVPAPNVSVVFLAGLPPASRGPPLPP